MRDQLVAKQLVANAISGQAGNQLNDEQFVQAFKVLTASPAAQQMKREAGKGAATNYLVSVLNKAVQSMKRSQKRSRQRDGGIER